MNKTYPEGIRAFSPRENAPSFVKGKVVINVDEFIQWMKNNDKLMTDYKGKQQLTLDLLEGKTGYYLAVDTYEKESPKGKTPQESLPPADDLPF